MKQVVKEARRHLSLECAPNNLDRPNFLRALPAAMISLALLLSSCRGYIDNTKALTIAKSTPGNPTQLVFTGAPARASSGLPLSSTLAVNVEDENGNIITGYITPITVSIANNPGGGALKGTNAVIPTAGTAVFSNLSIDRVGSGYTLQASSGSLTAGTSSAFDIGAGSLDHFMFAPATLPPLVAGTSAAVSIVPQDAAGNILPSFAGTVNLTSSDLTAVLPNCIFGAADFGFKSCTFALNTPGTHSLTASYQGVQSALSGILVSAPVIAGSIGMSSTLSTVVAAPTSITADGSTVSTVTVTLKDPNGFVVSGKTVSLSSSRGSADTISPASGVSNSSGVVTFTVKSTLAGTGTFTASDTTDSVFLTSQPTISFTAGAAATVAVYAGNNQSGGGGLALANPFAAVVTDANGNPVSGATVNWAVTAGGGSLSSASGTTNSSGQASTTLTLGSSPGTNSVTATVAGLTAASFSATTFSRTIASISASAGNNQSTAVGTALPTVLQAVVKDSSNIPIPGATVTWTVTTAGGSLSGISATTDSTGSSTATLTLGTVAGTNTVTAAANGFIATFTETGTPGSASQLVFTAQPPAATASVTLSPAPQVSVQDAYGNRVTTYSTPITLAIATNPGSGTLGGTLTVTPTSGVSSFSDININASGTGYSLGATSGGLSTTSNSFNVSDVPTHLAYLSSPAGRGYSSQTVFNPSIQVAVEDANGIIAGSSTVAITLALGTNTAGGTLSGTLTQPAVNGVATFSDLKLDKPATNYTLTASASGYSPLTSAAFTIMTGQGSQLSFSGPSHGTSGSCTGPIHLTVQDAGGNTVVNSSSSAGVITLSSTGSAAFYGTNTCSSTIPSVSVAPGQSTSGNFYVMDSALEAVTLTANGSTPGWGTHNTTSFTSETVLSLTYPSPLIFGQPDFSTVAENLHGFVTPAGVAVTSGGKLFAVDNYWGIVNGYNSLPTSSYPAADLIIAKYSSIQRSGSCTPIGVSPVMLSSPNGISTDGTRFIVADTGNHRVLIWNSIPTSFCTPADIVLGQPNFNTNFANQGQSSPSANTLSGPSAVLAVGTKLLVADAGNNRILVWNNITGIANGTAADLVIGQANFTTATANTGGRSGATLSNPQQMASDGTRLLVADYLNVRVLLFNTIPTVSGTAANFVLGEANLTAAGRSLTQSGMGNPQGVALAGGKIIVADPFYHRVLIWNSIPSANGVNADVVLGQTSFTTSTAPSIPTASTMNKPTFLATDGTHLFVSDSVNARILMWDAIPTASTTPADREIGQIDLNHGIHAGSTVSATSGFYRDMQVIVAGGKMIVPDVDNCRVLIWNTVPTASNTPADLVLGQPDFTSYLCNLDQTTGTISARTMSLPSAVWSDGTRLLVSDAGNYRILLWNTFPTASYTPADIVIGQTNFTNHSVNAGLGSVSANGLNTNTVYSPVKSDGTHIVVDDNRNNRALIWNSFPTTNGVPADVVIGQPDMISTTSNNGGVSASSLGSLNDIDLASGKLIAVDAVNRRVLIWNNIPTSNFAPADVVLGQPDFTSVVPYIGSDFQLKELTPSQLITDSGKLYVYSAGNILIWNSIPTLNYTPADGIYPFLPPGGTVVTTHPMSEYYALNGAFSISNNQIYGADYRLSRIATHPIYPGILHSNPVMNSLTGSLTMLTCSGISSVLANEGARPLAEDSGWQNCSTTPGAISFTLANNTVDAHFLNVWLKKSTFQVESDPFVLPVTYVSTNPLAPTVRLSSANPASSAAVTLSISNCNNNVYMLVSENPSVPDPFDPNWQFCGSAPTYSLSSQTSANHTIYLWGKDGAWNITSTPSTVSVFY